MGVSLDEYRQRIGCFVRVLSSFKVRGNTCQKQSKDYETALRVVIRLSWLVLLAAAVIQNSSVLDLTQFGDVEKNPGPNPVYAGKKKVSLEKYLAMKTTVYAGRKVSLEKYLAMKTRTDLRLPDTETPSDSCIGPGPSDVTDTSDLGSYPKRLDTETSPETRPQNVSCIEAVPTQLVKDLDSLTKQQICRELNVSRSLGGDYKTLAASLMMSSTDINLIEKKDNPAEEVLKWWETDDQATVGKLQSLFEEMTRDDLVLILKNRPKATSKKKCSKSKKRKEVGEYSSRSGDEEATSKKKRSKSKKKKRSR